MMIVTCNDKNTPTLYRYQRQTEISLYEPRGTACAAAIDNPKYVRAKCAV